MYNNCLSSRQDNKEARDSRNEWGARSLSSCLEKCSFSLFCSEYTGVHSNSEKEKKIDRTRARKEKDELSYRPSVSQLAAFFSHTPRCAFFNSSCLSHVHLPNSCVCFVSSQTLNCVHIVRTFCNTFLPCDFSLETDHPSNAMRPFVPIPVTVNASSLMTRGERDSSQESTKCTNVHSWLMWLTVTEQRREMKEH